MKQKIKQIVQAIIVDTVVWLYKAISNQYQESVGKIRVLFDRGREYAEKIGSFLLRRIERNHEKTGWMNIAGLLSYTVPFFAYCILSPVIAEYRREKGIRIFSIIALFVIGAIGLWELVSIIGPECLRCLGRGIRKFGRGTAVFCQKYLWFFKFFKPLFAIFIIVLVLAAELLGKLFIFFMRNGKAFVRTYPRIAKAGVYLLLPCAVLLTVCWACRRYETPTTAYYASVIEVYGMPRGVGELQPEELGERTDYWIIEEYSWRKSVVLTYMAPCRQLEIVQQNASVYDMALFRPSARIEVAYKTDKAKYNSLNQEAFETALGNKFREPEKISYYNSSGKLTLKLEKNRYGKFDITCYSSKDMPQLLNSTLLRIPADQTGENSMMSMQIETDYNSDGLPQTRRLSPYIYNAYGVNGESYAYDQNGRLATLCYLDINGEPVCNKLGIMRIDFQYEDNGNLHSIRYYSDEERTQKTEGFQGVFCEKFSYDSKGRLIERYQQDRNENMRNDTNGVCMYRYDYFNEEGAQFKEEYIGFDREPIRHRYLYSKSVSFTEIPEENGAWQVVVSMDSAGASLSVMKDAASMNKGKGMQLFFGFIQQDLQDGLSDLVGKYSLQENPTDMLNKGAYQTDSDESPDEDSKQDGILGNQSGQLKQQGLQDSAAIFIEQDSPQTNWADVTENRSDTEIDMEQAADIVRNYESVRYVIDVEGKISSLSYYDQNGQLILNEEGYAGQKFEYDNQKRVECEQYVDVMGNLCRINDGYAVVRNQYESDQGDELCQIQYLDVDGRTLAFNRKLGYAYAEYEHIFDDTRKIICSRYFDQNRDPARIPDKGYVMTKQYYNERNFLTQEIYYNKKDEKTCRTDWGVAEIFYEYEDSGNLIREFYKDADGQLVNRSDTGYAMIYRKYENGQMVSCRYEGYRNRMLENVADKFTGAAAIEYVYEGAQEIRREYYDTEGMLVLCRDKGYAVQEFQYDDNGNVCAEYYYDTKEEPVLRQDTGYATVRFRNDIDGRLGTVRFYDTAGKLIISTSDHCAGFDYEYDEKGNRDQVRYIGTDGNMMVRQDLGYAQVKITYDLLGEIEKEEYLDAEENPAIRKGRGYASYRNQYENGNWIETQYLGRDGKPVLRLDTGYAMIRNKYDDKGRLISQVFLDADEQPQPVISTKYYCAGFHYMYSEDDNKGGLNVKRAVEEDDETETVKITEYIDLDGNRMVRRDLGYAMVRSVYDDAGNEVNTAYFDAAGKPAVAKGMGCASYCSTYENGNWMESWYYDEDGNPTLREDEGYAVIRNTYDEEGRRISQSYYDVFGQPVISTKYYCAGYIYEYEDSAEQNKKISKCIGLDGNLMIRRDLGYAQVESTYDDAGNEVAVSYLDIKGNPVRSKQGGYASYQSIYENGRWMEGRYYDEYGGLVTGQDTGYAVIVNGYDKYGQRILERYLDESREAVISTEQGCASRRFEYDESGNIVHAEFLGLDGELMVRKDLGYAQVDSEYDDDGHEVRVSYLDIDGKLAARKEKGYAWYTNTYDKKGYLVESWYYGRDNKLKLRSDTGYAGIVKEYDEYGQCVSESYFDTEKQPVVSSEYHCARFAYGYDERGNRTGIRYYDEDLVPMLREDLGFAKVVCRYDSAGHTVSESYFGVEDEPAARKAEGYASYIDTYDERGNWIEGRYYDINGELVSRSDTGYAVIVNEYDEYGQRTLEVYCDAAEQPVISSEYHCAGFAYEYDERGDMTRVTYFDENMAMMVREGLGYAGAVCRYDDVGNELSESYFGMDGEPVCREEGDYASYEDKYDKKGNWIESRYYDQEGKLKARSDTGYAVLQNEYDEYDQLISQTYYVEGRDGQLEPAIWKERYCAGMKFEYDENRNLIRREYIGLDGEPMVRKDLGYAIVVWEYDEYHRMSATFYYDADGKSVNSVYGYARTEVTYDSLEDEGNDTNYDTDGNVVEL